MIVHWINNASPQQLRELWWMASSVCGALFFLSTFVAGGQTLLKNNIWNEAEKNVIIRALGRKWELVFVALFLFCGVLFAAFPRFFITGFGGANLLWIVLSISLIAQPIAFENRQKSCTLFGHDFYEKILWGSGVVIPLFFGVFIGGWFTGVDFTVDSAGVTHWHSSLRGLELIFSFTNLAIGLFFVFNARVLGAIYLLTRREVGSNPDMARKLRVGALGDFKRGLVALVIMLFVIFSLKGLSVSDGGEIVAVAGNYLISTIEVPGLLFGLVGGLLFIAAAVVAIPATRTGVCLAGAGTFLFSLSLLCLAGLNNASFYPSSIDPAASLTIHNSSAGIELLRSMARLLPWSPFLAVLLLLLLKPGRGDGGEAEISLLGRGIIYLRATLSFSQMAASMAAFVALLILLFPPAAFSPTQAGAAALAVLVIGCWATSILSPHLTAFILFLLCMLFKIVPANVIFSGFTSAALWLIFSGLVMGVAIKNTGLGERIANKVAALLISRGYGQIIGGVVAFSLLLGFIMPSAMGRIVLLIPIALALAESFGFKEGSNGRKGVILAATFGSSIPAFTILPSNVPNMVMAGTAETIYNISPMYGEYLLLHFPILGLMKAAIIAFLVARLYPDQPAMTSRAEKKNEPMSMGERKLAAVLTAVLLLWMFDFAHHISPAWVALGASVLLLMPHHGLVTKAQFNGKINYGSLFFVAGVLGLGAMVAHSGLGGLLAQGLMKVLPLNPDSSLLNYLSLSMTAIATGVATTVPGAPAVLTPLAADMAEVSDLPIKTILMSQVLGFSTIIFPYQAPPLVVGMQMAGEKMQSAIKLCLILALITFVLLLPLNFLWWKILGWI